MLEFRTHQETTWAPKLDLIPRYVVCAANRYGEIIIAGARHHDNIMRNTIAAIGDGDWKKGYHILAGVDLNSPSEEQGFIDQFGVFMSREEAAHIIEINKQSVAEPDDIDGFLISENLY